MKRQFLLSRLFSVFIATLLLVFFSLPAAASDLPATKIKLGTVITLTRLPATPLGESFTLQGEIKDLQGRPVKNRSIQFKLDDTFLGQTRSDNYGLFEREFNKELDAGFYEIVAYWNGTSELAPTTSTMKLQILPAVVTVQTVPVIAGLPFKFDKQRAVSDQAGQAVFKINKPGEYRLDVLVDEYSNPNQRIEFGRWLEESYEPYSIIKVPRDKPVPVGLNVFRLVGQTFLDLDGYPVDPARITEFMIRSAQGDVFIFHDGQPRWIPSSRIARRITGLEETKLLYSVISVIIDGSNVVNQSQQRFFTYPTENWPISLLLYSMKITARDGLFGTPVGKSVNVTFPDGQVKNYPLDENGSVVIHSLARGNYYTELVGTMGMKNRIPVALSRNQNVLTKVITYVDMAVVGLLGALLALGLLLYGRPSLLHILRPLNDWLRRKPSSQPLPLPEPREPRRGTGPLTPESLPRRGTGPLTSPAVLISVDDSETSGQLFDYSNLRYENVRLFDDEEFKRSVGVERDHFEKMLSSLQSELDKVGRKARLSPADQLLLTIVFLREQVDPLEIAPAFGISQGTVRRTIKRVRDALRKSGEFKSLGSIFQPAHPLLAVGAGEMITSHGAEG